CFPVRLRRLEWLAPVSRVQRRSRAESYRPPDPLRTEPPIRHPGRIGQENGHPSTAATPPRAQAALLCRLRIASWRFPSSGRFAAAIIARKLPDLILP